MRQLADEMSKDGLPISRSYLNSFLLADLTDQTHRWSFEHIHSIFRFIESNSSYREFIDTDRRVLDSKRLDSSFFSSGYYYFDAPFNRDYATLVSLVGTYAMFRPIWSSPIPDYYVRSIVDIKQSGDAFMFSELQEYTDPQHVKVNELSEGYIFPFGSVIFSITNEIDYKCRRFVCMHNYSSTPNKTPGSIDKFYGEIKSISPEHIGPPAQSFICRRIYDGLLDCRVISGSDLLDEDHAYFNPPRARQRKRKR